MVYLRLILLYNFIHKLCSSLLSFRKDFYPSRSTFKLPSDHGVPVMMVGAGSGIAPFRGFWQNRQIVHHHDGKSYTI